MKRALMAPALGDRPAELVLKGGSVLDVFTKRFFPADVAIEDGYIVGLGSYSGRREVDLSGKAVVPGFIDGHVHMESSMVSPGIFARHILPRGTTTVIADPHEIANVAGGAGIDYLLTESESAPVNIYIMLPSAVPLGQFDRGGGVFGPAQMAEVLEAGEVLGLGEVMDVEAVLRGEADIWEKLDLNRRGILDGHAPGLTGRRLQAYLLAGIATDHECSNYPEAREKLQSGMFLLLREGSAARNVTDILRGAVAEGIPLDRCGFCTDDKHLGDIDTQGHIDRNIRLAIDAGVPPEVALSMASYHTARAYGLGRLGAVAPGYRADLVVLEDIRSVRISDVYRGGVPLERCLAETPARAPEPLRRTVRVPELSPERLALTPGGPFPVISLVPGQILTTCVWTDLPVDRRGRFVPGNGLLKVAVIHRHHDTGELAVGALRGFGLRGGALASTVGHDAHNLIVVGDSDGDMLLAIDALRECQGGYALAAAGRVLGTIPLPVAGLISDDPEADIPGAVHKLEALCRKMGVPEDLDPFQNLSFLPLAVIPEIRITDRGIYSVTEGKFIASVDKL